MRGCLVEVFRSLREHQYVGVGARIVEVFRSLRELQPLGAPSLMIRVT